MLENFSVATGLTSVKCEYHCRSEDWIIRSANHQVVSQSGPVSISLLLFRNGRDEETDEGSEAVCADKVC